MLMTLESYISLTANIMPVLYNRIQGSRVLDYSLQVALNSTIAAL